MTDSYEPTKTANTRVVIELSEHDAYKVLWLCQREANDGTIWNEYWERVANEIRAFIEANAAGFFQCSACHRD